MNNPFVDSGAGIGDLYPQDLPGYKGLPSIPLCANWPENSVNSVTSISPTQLLTTIYALRSSIGVSSGANSMPSIFPLSIMHVEVSPGGPGYILSFGRGGFFPLPPLRTRAQ